MQRFLHFLLDSFKVCKDLLNIGQQGINTTSKMYLRLKKGDFTKERCIRLLIENFLLPAKIFEIYPWVRPILAPLISFDY